MNATEPSGVEKKIHTDTLNGAFFRLKALGVDFLSREPCQTLDEGAITMRMLTQQFWLHC